MANRVLPKKNAGMDVYTLALERIRRTYELCDNVAVSFSGGKDSTVALHLTLEVARELGRLPLRVVFWDEEAIHPETVDYVRRVSQMPDVAFEWYCVPVKHRNACSRRVPYWNCWAPEDEAKWTRPLPPEALLELPVPGFDRHPIPECNSFLFPKSKGTHGFILGLRADESLRRYRVVARRVADNFISHDTLAPHVYLSKPIYDWRTTDIWSAPRRFGWDYNRAYDVMTAAGITRHDQRVCPPYGEEPLRGLWQYAQCWPELWAKMVARVPGAATAARYARSPLYAFSGNDFDEKADPHELIRGALERWPEETRAKVAARVKGEIDNHYRKQPGVPIPSTEAGSSGVTWKYLYMLAVRGDFKGRKTPNYNRAAKPDVQPSEETGRW